MKGKAKHIKIFEHQTIRENQIVDDVTITSSTIKALQSFYGEKGVPYYSLIHKGIKFNEYVGVIQVGNNVIEVLPKADKNSDKELWMSVLIDMLYAVGIFNVHAPSSSNLQLKTNSLLNIYFELFISELEYLLHRGLVKKYRSTENNIYTLKGSIQFSKHLNRNLTHKERFYVNYTTYDKEHQLHAIFFKVLKLLNRINTNSNLSSRLGSLLLDFPEQKEINVSESTFDRIVLDRKTEPYRNALEISRLILLNYHPDLKAGNNNVLALMFDMNVLWEQFVYVSLNKYKAKETTITAQNIKYFWKPTFGFRSKMKPDIVLNKDKENCIVLDTKWKNIEGYNPSPEDLRQMFVYMKYYKAKKVALIYPGSLTKIREGTFYQESNGLLSDNKCSVITIGVNKNIKSWQAELNNQISEWITFS